MLYVVHEAMPKNYAWKIHGAPVTHAVWAGYRLDATAKLKGGVAGMVQRQPMEQYLLVGLTSVRAGTTILTQPNLRRKSIAAILRLLDRHVDVHGIQLDFEYLPPTHAENFVAFVRSLRSELPRRVSLYIAVFPPIGMPEAWSAFHKLPELAATTDGIVVMLYDYHRQGTKPGCVSGLKWLDENAAALARLPRSKVWLGAPLYGYRFDGRKASALSRAGFTKIKGAEKNADGCHEKIISDEAAAYYPSPGLYERYETLRREHDFAGIAYWRAGLEK